MDEGIMYSPRSEETFREIYGSNHNWSAFSDASFASCSVTLKSTSGSVVYFKGTPIAWKSSRQTIRAYSTAESEYVAVSDVIVLSQGIGFADFYDTDDIKNCPIYCDNQSAIKIAQSNEFSGKSRHFALRLMRVKDESDRVRFVPTTLQKADGLTKNCSPAQRMMLLHNESGRVNDHFGGGDDGPDGESVYFALMNVSHLCC